jgi:hypothetical protein
LWLAAQSVPYGQFPAAVVAAAAAQTVYAQVMVCVAAAAGTSPDQAVWAYGRVLPTGLKEEDMGKPQVGISSMWYEGNPCNMHLLSLAEHVKAGVVSTTRDRQHFVAQLMTSRLLRQLRAHVQAMLRLDQEPAHIC